ncbi:MAG: hypothetical protein GPJ52_04590 [Candidatus Heimdallarchaeota archaeon]|nr:hypothetical protein [Candidatus Heimdallarchaeota archaeon]
MIPHNPTMNFDLTLYTPEFDPHQNLRDAGLQETVIRSSRSTDNFTIYIAPVSVSDVGNYSFTLSLINQNDFDSGTDAGNTFGDSLSITSGVSNGTLVWGSDDEDFYQISLVKGEIIDIDLVPLNTTNVDIFFYNEEPRELDKSENIIGINESIYYSISVPGDYSLQVILIDNIGSDVVIPYNITITITTQNDANSGTDAGNTAVDAHFIIPLRDSTFNGHLVYDGDLFDFFEFSIDYQSKIFARLVVPQTANFDLFIYNSEIIEIYSSTNTLASAPETIWGEVLQNGTYFIVVEFIYSGEAEGSYAYTLNIGLDEIVENPNGPLRDWQDILLKVISYAIVPLLLIVIIIFFIYEYTDARLMM